ncbi:MAG: ATP-binding cassette domain-containing protein [Patescibacteria group bacterium]|nr:ATP-binding cassette domain-containing protein [Patescibacteria group bacterium]
MKKVLLKVEKLKVRANQNEILKGINLQIKEGEVQALLGPNGSGKTVLSQIILGNSKYKITEGKIFFLGKEITKSPPEKRAKLGMALVWQAPPAVKGVKLSQLLAKISVSRGPSFVRLIEARPLLEREINVDFSGGEKKISELLQVLSLNPKLVIFDEIDSGLDIKRLEKVAKIIKKELIGKPPHQKFGGGGKKVSVLLITHWGQILKFLKPDLTNVMLNGKIICKSKDFKKVLMVIKKYGYEKCKRCPLLASRP